MHTCAAHKLASLINKSSFKHFMEFSNVTNFGEDLTLSLRSPTNDCRIPTRSLRNCNQSIGAERERSGEREWGKTTERERSAERA